MLIRDGFLSTTIAILSSLDLFFIPKEVVRKKVKNCHKTNQNRPLLVYIFGQSFVKSSEKLVPNKQTNRQQLVCTVIIDY